jgi:endonuclease-3
VELLADGLLRPGRVCYHAAMNPTNPLRTRARRIGRELARLYPEAPCPLAYTTPVQLLVATILAAQCTDALVNKVTPALFARYPDAHALAAAERKELEKLIRSVTFFRTKARNIILCCRALVERFDGQVPPSMDDLVSLAGVGRKTASVVLGNAFGLPALAVDTHVARLSQRLGLSSHTDRVKIESDLTSFLPEKDWCLFGLRLIYHGRQVCRARKPHCDRCGLESLCPRVGVVPAAVPPPASGGPPAAP